MTLSCGLFGALTLSDIETIFSGDIDFFPVDVGGLLSYHAAAAAAAANQVSLTIRWNTD